MCSRTEQWCPTYSFSVSVTDVILNLVDMETNWIPSNRNTYLNNNLNDFGTEKKIKERLSLQDREMDLGETLKFVGQKNFSGKLTTVKSNEQKQLWGSGLCQVYFFDTSSNIFFLNQVRN